MDPQTYTHVVYAICSTVCVVMGSIFTAIAQGRVITQTCDSMARQPELSGDLRFTMIIGLAMIESLAIYCLLVALVLLFVRW